MIVWSETYKGLSMNLLKYFGKEEEEAWNREKDLLEICCNEAHPNVLQQCWHSRGLELLSSPLSLSPLPSPLSFLLLRLLLHSRSTPPRSVLTPSPSPSPTHLHLHLYSYPPQQEIIKYQSHLSFRSAADNHDIDYGKVKVPGLKGSSL